MWRESGIRTREAGFSRLHTFQACSFNRSDTSPLNSRDPSAGLRRDSFGPRILRQARAGTGARVARGQLAGVTSAVATWHFTHVLSRPCAEVAPPAVRRAGRAGTCRARAHQRARYRAGAPRLPVHRHARGRQDHHRAHLRQVAELRARHVAPSRAASAMRAATSTRGASSTCSRSTRPATPASTTSAS